MFYRISDMKNMQEETNHVYKVAGEVRAGARVPEMTPC